MSAMQEFFIAVKAIAILSYLVLVISVIQSKAERNVRLLFSVYVSGMLFWQVTSLMVSLSATARAALLWYNLAVAGTGTANILFYPFAKAFAKGRARGALIRFAYACCGLMFAVGCLGLTWREVVVGRGGYWVPVYNSVWLLVLGPIWYFFYACGILVLLRNLSREDSPERRNRIRYVLVGASFVVIGITTDLTPLRDYPVDITFNLISALITGYAVIRYKLLDIRFVLVRSLFYSTMTASLIAAYILLIFGLEKVLQSGMGYSRSIYGILAVLVLAFIFLPVRNALQALLDRLFFREKGDYQKETQALSRKIATLYDAGAILELVCDSVERTVKTTFVAASLYDAAGGSYVVRKSRGRDAELAADMREDAGSGLARWLAREGRHLVREEALNDPQTAGLVRGASTVLASAAASIVVPILLDERLLGMLILGQKLSGQIYNGDDLSFLATISNQAATALDKSEIFLKIRRRLSEQTLLFILSQKFRGSSDFDQVMDSIVEVLKSFLGCVHCALVYLDKTNAPSRYSQDRLSGVAAELCAAALLEKAEAVPGGELEEPAFRGRVVELAAARPDLSEREVGILGSLAYRPLADGDLLLGALAISDPSGAGGGLEQESELLRTIQAIVSQGIVLRRTIVDLLDLERDNEKILDSLNDMGDTLVILDRDGCIRKVNKATCKTLEYSEEELIGEPIAKFIADYNGILSPVGLRDILENRPVSNQELGYRSRSGAHIPMLFSGSAIAGEDGRNREVIGIARDMTERRKAEDAMKNLLLVREIHHRIKNNLQVISSLLALQANYVEDAGVKEMFRESQLRVRSMALIHEKLYGSQEPSLIDFREYIKDLARYIMTSYGPANSQVSLEIEIGSITLDMDTAVPCGLIVNELVANSLKHAFPDGRSGRVVVALLEGDAAGSYELRVEDDGIGIPEAFSFETSKSLGLKIVATLTRQLHGTIRVSRYRGSAVSVFFSDPA